MKIAIPLSEQGRWSAETIWAEPLGQSLYKVRNLVWLADNLHALDVVRCEEGEGDLPRMIEVVERSGHDTLRLIFTDKAPEDLRLEVLNRLHSTLGNFERGSDDGWMFDVNPGTDLASAEQYLARLQREGYLE